MKRILTALTFILLTACGDLNGINKDLVHGNRDIDADLTCPLVVIGFVIAFLLVNDILNERKQGEDEKKGEGE